MKSFKVFAVIVIISFALFCSLVAVAQDKHQCTATTKKGTQCMHKTTGQYCKIHDPASLRCGVITKAGKLCNRTVKNVGDKCFQHKIN